MMCRKHIVVRADDADIGCAFDFQTKLVIACRRIRMGKIGTAHHIARGLYFRALRHTFEVACTAGLRTRNQTLGDDLEFGVDVHG